MLGADKIKGIILSIVVKHSGKNILVWRCFYGLGIGDLKKIEGKMDKTVHHQILICHSVPSGPCLVDHGFVYQQKNDHKQTSQLCKKYLEKKKLRKGFSFLIGLKENPIEHIF